MPGLVVFRRRWSVGSDDLVVPGVFLFTLHVTWLVIMIAVLAVVKFDRAFVCVDQIWWLCVAYLGVLAGSALLDLFVSLVALRGGILETEARKSINLLLYFRLGVMLVEIAWLTVGVVWLVVNYKTCPIESAKEVILGLVVCNWLIMLIIGVTVWCVFDAAGRSWVKMQQFQRSMRENESSRFQYKRSGRRGGRNWRQRKVIRAYQDSWDHRCRLLFCCMGNNDRNKNSFADIARLLSDFFRDLDVVPSDVIAGLVLLRKFQKIEREAVVNERKNETFEYLSGVAVTSNTKFVAVGDENHVHLFQTVIHYMHYALAAYGWPMFLITHTVPDTCKFCFQLKCSCLPSCWWHRAKPDNDDEPVIIEDNCCHCNYTAFKNMVASGDIDVVYATYHVDIGETPFFVVIDYTKQKIVICIRGTWSMKDVITDLNAESECLPLDPPKDDWLGHKGMVNAAEYIKKKLESEDILNKAKSQCEKKAEGKDFGLVLVGHSLGAGTAAILAILLRPKYPDLHCYSFSPPGGLLSLPAVEYTKSFITSVVLGKDVVPRIGLHQMEALRADLINAIKRSKDPKWKTIVCSFVCCGCAPMPTSAIELRADSATMKEYQREKDAVRSFANQPNDTSISLSFHQPLFPPGKIIHIVRHHPTKEEQKYETWWRRWLNKHEPVYQALWANNTDFDEVLISPVMIQDHMPDKVLDSLNRVITSMGPAKPQRSATNISAVINLREKLKTSPNSTPPPTKLCLETSFASVQAKRDSLKDSLKFSNGVAWDFSSNELPPSYEASASRSKSKIDLIHDDWYGLAPLAKAESLSEVSSIGSRGETYVMARLDDCKSSNDNVPTTAEFEKFFAESLTEKKEPAGGDEDLIENFTYESSPLLNILHNPKIAEFLSRKEDTSSSDCFYEMSPNSSKMNSPFTKPTASVHSSGTGNDVYFSLESETRSMEPVTHSSSESPTLHHQEDSSVTSTFTDCQFEECPEDLKTLPLDEEYASVFNSSYKTCSELPSDYSLRRNLCDNSATCDLTSDSDWSHSRAPSSTADNVIVKTPAENVITKSARGSDTWNNNEQTLVNLIGDNKGSGQNGAAAGHSEYSYALRFNKGESSV
ncbi:diacylglycerol lipase-alpha isoform X1 [Bemisia tabaci]|uniref:diacylglycerol lipase-alpha isoform X1 n=1 Tax=Bemisia tabaci TaxID=7038 RepID=UPI003B282FEE